jgi:hypothetical protein
MNTNRLISTLLASLMLTGSALPSAASLPRVDTPDMPVPFANASAECYSIGQQYASREGGELYNATAETRGGQRVCVIVVVIRTEGQRPRRAEFIVPL